MLRSAISAALIGDTAHFAREDEVEAAWAWTEPILHHWQATDVPLHRYPAGTAGPAAAAELIERDGRHWHQGALA